MEFKSMIDFLDPDIFTCTETWLNNTIQDKDIVTEERFKVYRNDRQHTTGGGVLCVVKQEIKSTRRFDLESISPRHNELLAIEINPNMGDKFLLISAYRSQTDPSKDFLANLEEILRNSSSNDIFNILILGDLNYSQITWTPNNGNRYLPPHCKDLLSLCNRWNFSQLNHHPSRKDSNNILDLILSNMPYQFSEVICQPFEYRSDHFLLNVDILLSPLRTKPTPRTVYNYRKAKTDLIKRDLNLLSLPNTDNPNTLWSSFKNQVMSIINRHIPKIKIKNKTSPPWIDDYVINLSKRKEHKYLKAKKSKIQEDWNDYKQARNHLKNVVHNKYKEYISNLGSNLLENPKKFWSLLGARTKSRGAPEKITKDGIELTETKDKANAINQYFCSVFTDWNDRPIPPTTPSLNPNLSNIVIPTSEVEKSLLNLNPTKAPGPDGIPTKILKDYAKEIAPTLTTIFNTSLKVGIVPKDWKRANVCAIHKKGKKCDPSNYRPISLLPVCSKILERCIYNQIIEELRPQISSYQHGFLSKSSTNTQLLTFFDQINDNLDDKHDTDIVYFDLSKAFDSVPHPPVLDKLKSFGINGKLHAWFTNYLTNRNQRVILDGETSPWLQVTSGVPQGSILGPLIFLLYINDLPDILSESTLCGIFADDTKIARKITTPNDHIILQEDITSLKTWGDKWGLTFNCKKCKHLRIGTQDPDNIQQYKLDNHTLESVNDMLDLGVTITTDFKWSTHINNICKKAEGRLWLIIRTLGFFSPIIAKKTAYIALIRSILEYSSQIWNPKYKNLQKSLEDIQRKATNYILNNPRYDHPDHINYKTRLLTLNLLPTSYRREILDLTLLLKTINGNTNLDLSQKLSFVQRAAGIQTRQITQGTKLKFINTNTDKAKHFFTNRVIETWNSLPDYIRLALKNTDNPLVIKQHLIPYYRRMLSNHFDPYNQCTWVTTCKCSRC
jgi:hypothetical protein